MGEWAVGAPTRSPTLNAATRPMPLEITRANECDVRIRWSDGHDFVYPARYLRTRCCCAVCTAAADVPADRDVHPVAIHAVGGYAIQFEWSDGHRAGLYSYAYLRGICPCPDCARPQSPG